MARALRIALAAITAVVLIGLAPMTGLTPQDHYRFSGPGESPDGG